MKDYAWRELSDEQLIAGIRQGNRDCSGQLYKRHYSKVYAKCFSFTRNHDDAFDMTQEVLLKAICNVGSFGGNSRFTTWLYAITQNYCISNTQKRNRVFFEDVALAELLFDDGADKESFEERVHREVLEAHLDDFMSLLTEEERALLDMKYRKNYSVKDLQKELELSASAVKMRLHRARLKMNQILNLEAA